MAIPTDTLEPGLFPIRTVSEMTGVHPTTLRAWERRHGLIQPNRTTTGHRLYSQDEVDRIRRIVALLDDGVSISRIPQLLANGDSSQAGGNDNWDHYRYEMVYAIGRFDENLLDAIYNEAQSLYPVDIVTRRLLTPLLQTLGDRWRQVPGAIAEEHFFAVYLRNKLGARFHHAPLVIRNRTLLTACLPREQHETGILLFGLAARELGFHTIMLGANTPLRELHHPIRRSAIDAVVLSGSVTPDPVSFYADLSELARSIAQPVFIGGRTAKQHADHIHHCRAIPLDDDIPRGLQQIARALNISGASDETDNN